MSRNKLCSISTVARGNRAHINTAFFAFSNDFELYFLSDPDSFHCRNLARNPSMAMTIFDSSQEWEASGRGLQLFGVCHRTRGDAERRATQVYGFRFPAYARWMKARTDADRRRVDRLRSYALYRFLPNRVKILDEKEFGGAVFVIATVDRRRPREMPGLRSRFRWRSTERLLP
jgi:uncharacterized protein YhbP (UPF0306 family)